MLNIKDIIWLISNPLKEFEGNLIQKIEIKQISIEKGTCDNYLFSGVEDFQRSVKDLAQIIKRFKNNNKDINLILVYENSAKILRGWVEEYLDKE